MMVGAALALCGEHDAAVPYLRTAARLAGQDSAAHVRLGAVALHLGKPAEAAALMRKVEAELALQDDPARPKIARD